MLKREYAIRNVYQYDTANPIRWIASHLLRYKHYLVSFLLGSIIMTSVTALIPILAGTAVGAVVDPQADMLRLGSICIAILLTVLFRFVANLVRSFSAETLGRRITRDARDELYLNLIGKSQTFYDRQRIGDLMARVANDINSLSTMMNPGADLLIYSTLHILIPILFIGLIRAELLIWPVIFTLAFSLTLRSYARRIGPINGRMRAQFGVLNAGLAEVISGIEVVKSGAQEAREVRTFHERAQSYRDLFVQNQVVQARYLPPLLFTVTLAATLLHSIYLFDAGALSLAAIVAVLGLMGILVLPTNFALLSFSLVQLGLSGAIRVLAILNEQSDLDENAAGHSAHIQSEIVFENVSFAYDDVAVLKDITFCVQAGQTIAIVGRTGSGKTTLTRLINRTYDVCQGRILIDGVDVREWNLDSLRSQISSIEQDVFLFSKSVEENIGFGLGQRASMEAIRQAAREAKADEFINALPAGYKTVIGERGVTLSGGQRQRLALARALLTDPRILVLDDSTSAIDSATEDEIQKALFRVTRNRMTLLITHRLSQIRWADKILVLNKGELVDQGTHDELMERCKDYSCLFTG